MVYIADLGVIQFKKYITNLCILPLIFSLSACTKQKDYNGKMITLADSTVLSESSH